MKHANLLDEEWEFLTDFLPTDWREQARSSGALRRARGIANADCLLQLILMHTATGLSLRQTVVRAREQSIADISDVALLKRLRSSEKWLQQLTSQMTEMGDTALLKRLSQRRRIRVVDATTVEEQGGAGTDWRVHYTLCLPDLSCDFFELTDEHGGESYRRICAIRKSAVATVRAQEKMRHQARKKQKQVNEEALKLAAFIMVFTTASQKELGPEEVLELYRVRWQIELRFKHLKSLLGLGCLPKYDAQSCRAWIQAKLLCGLLIERLMREAKFFFPWGYRLPAAEPLARIH